MEHSNDDPGVLVDFSASLTTASGEELQQVLEIRSIRRRIERPLIPLKREVEISRLKGEISQRIEERLSKQQREFFLREQLKEIKKELGLAKDDSEAHVERFRERLTKLTLPDEARERVQEKILATKRAGVERLLLPADNREDFEDLPDHARSGLEVSFVKTFDEVRRICFPRSG